MKKMLNIKGIKVLSKQQQQSVTAGYWEGDAWCEYTPQCNLICCYMYGEFSGECYFPGKEGDGDGINSMPNGG